MFPLSQQIIKLEVPFSFLICNKMEINKWRKAKPTIAWSDGRVIITSISRFGQVNKGSIAIHNIERKGIMGI